MELIKEILEIDKVPYTLESNVFLCENTAFVKHDLNRNFHRKELQEMHKNYESRGITLYQIAGNLSAMKIRNFLRAKLSLHPKIGARSTSLVELSNEEFFEFNKKWHIQGGASSHVRYGLSYEGNLVAAIGFTHVNGEWNLNRMVFGNVAVVGGASKLLKAFIDIRSPEFIVTYSNNGYSDGGVYKSLGFIQTNETACDMWYSINGELLNRRGFQKKKLESMLKHYDSSLTEVENMKRAGYFVYYGPGTKRWELHL